MISPRPDCLYLCATSRLAQGLRNTPAVEGSAWLTPRAMTLGQWLDELLDECLLTGETMLPQALDPYAEGLLWEKVIAASLGEAMPLFDLAGMAATAAEAHCLCRIWGLKPGGEFLSDEGRQFLAWQADFLRACTAGGWLDQAGVHLALLELIEAGQLALPERVCLLGFDRLTPFERRLQQVLSARGVLLEAAPHLPVAGRIQVHVGEDVRAECRAAVDWAAHHLQARPSARLGIVAPDLAGVRDCLEDLLDRRFHPDLLRPDAAEVPRCFNFSLGRPLAELPLVRTALDLLALGAQRGKLEQARWAALCLASGWSASVGEADGRARFAAEMRRGLPYFVSLSGLLRFGERLAERGQLACPVSLAALQGLADVFAQMPRTAYPSAWASLFRRALKAVDWPGERALSSDEYQAHRALGEVLDSFAGLDAVLGKVKASEAIRRLRELARQRVFQPETRGRPAIQVLGILESAGLNFDALWIIGLNDDRWPPAPRPNPLLPAELQRAAGSAHASAEVELDFARRVQARLLAAAPEIQLSWSQADGNRLLRPSPLLRDLPSAEPLPSAIVASLPEASNDLCEWIEDWQAPPVAAGENVRGGSWILRAQAICPAWAFYQFRLGAGALETPVEGLNPADRGTLVHRALEAFWLHWRTQEALLALSPEQLSAAIQAAVDSALDGFESERRVSLPTRFRCLEGERLVRLLERWLALEAARPQGFTVVACEQPAELEIEGIRVRMSVDRIDRLADGSQLILDYKTGQRVEVANWSAERITEPQLPIYAALVEPEVAGVVFAKVLLDKPGFSGVAASECLPGVSVLGEEKQKIFPAERFPDWASVQAHWRKRLTAVAGEIRAGIAGVQFADEADLRYCEVLPILRLPERQRWLAEQLAGPARQGGAA